MVGASSRRAFVVLIVVIELIGTKYVFLLEFSVFVRISIDFVDV
jgi:hypothetical protein